jgi:hypothetical protein
MKIQWQNNNLHHQLKHLTSYISILPLLINDENCMKTNQTRTLSINTFHCVKDILIPLLP